MFQLFVIPKRSGLEQQQAIICSYDILQSGHDPGGGSSLFHGMSAGPTKLRLENPFIRCFTLRCDKLILAVDWNVIQGCHLGLSQGPQTALLAPHDMQGASWGCLAFYAAQKQKLLSLLKCQAQSQQNIKFAAFFWLKPITELVQTFRLKRKRIHKCTNKLGGVGGVAVSWGPLM